MVFFNFEDSEKIPQTLVELFEGKDLARKYFLIIGLMEFSKLIRYYA
jgi:hypothetical protein